MGHDTTFHRHLIVGIVALNLFVVALTALFLSDSQQQYETAARIKAEDIALELEHDIADTYYKVDLGLQALSDQYTLLTRSGQLDEPAWEQALSRQRERLPMLLVLRAADASGHVRYGIGDLPEGHSPVSVADRQDFQRLRDNPQAGLQISGPIRGGTSRTSNLHGLVLSRRLADAQGQFAGVARAAITLDHFVRLFSALRIGNQGSISLRDQQLRLIVHQPPLDGEAGAMGSTTVSNDFRQAIASNPAQGSYTAGATSIDGVRRLQSYLLNDKYHFYINVGAALEDIHLPWWRQVWSTLGLVAMFLAVSALLAFLLARAWRRQRQSEENFRLLLDSAPFGTMLIEADDRIVLVNHTFQQMLGYTLADISDLSTWRHKAYPDAAYRQKIEREWQEAIKAPTRMGPSEHAFCVRCANGEDKEIAFMAVALPDSRRLVTMADVTQQRVAERQLKLAASVFSHASEGIMICDRNLRIVDVNEGFTRITGYSHQEAIGQTPRLLRSNHHSPDVFTNMMETLARTGQWSGEIWNRHKSGELFVERSTISTVRDEAGAISHYVKIFSDITSQKLHEEKMERSAHFDLLTGVPNRLLLADRMVQATAQVRRSGGLLAVCYLDLDGFKPINDTYGHQVGDYLLVEIAQRIKNCLRGGDTVARVGGDEFVLLLAVEGRCECEEALARILELLVQPVAIGELQITVSASLGFTLFPQDNSEPSVLLEHADQAMYIAKSSGKSRLYIFEPLLD